MVEVCVDSMYKWAHHFMDNSSHFVLKTELLLTMLSNFDKKWLLKTQLFDGYVFNPYEVL